MVGASSTELIEPGNWSSSTRDLQVCQGREIGAAVNILITGCTGFLGSTVIDHLVQKGTPPVLPLKDPVLFSHGKIESCAARSIGTVGPPATPRRRRLHYSYRRLHGQGIDEHKDVSNQHSGTPGVTGIWKKTGVQRFVFLFSGACMVTVIVFSPRSHLIRSVSTAFQSITPRCWSPPIDLGLSRPIILRLFFPYGPGQTRGIIPRLIDSIRNKSPITIYNEGNPAINPIFVDGVVHAIERAMLSDGHHTVNLCGDEVTRIGEMSQFIGELLQVEPLFVYEKDKAISNLVGEHFAGCCYGKPTNLPWAVTFTDPKTLALAGIPLHPTQLYSATGLFFIFLILLFLRKHTKFSGQLSCLYLVFHSSFRVFIEFFRGDPRAPLWDHFFSLTQGISLVTFFIALSLYFYLQRIYQQRG